VSSGNTLGFWLGLGLILIGMALGLAALTLTRWFP
jgi:hypothetical protein